MLLLEQPGELKPVCFLDRIHIFELINGFDFLVSTHYANPFALD